MSKVPETLFEVGDVVRVVDDDLAMSGHFGRIFDISDEPQEETGATVGVRYRIGVGRFRVVTDYYCPYQLQLTHPREAELLRESENIPDA